MRSRLCWKCRRNNRQDRQHKLPSWHWVHCSSQWCRKCKMYYRCMWHNWHHKQHTCHRDRSTLQNIPGIVHRLLWRCSLLSWCTGHPGGKYWRGQDKSSRQKWCPQSGSSTRHSRHWLHWWRLDIADSFNIWSHKYSLRCRRCTRTRMYSSSWACRGHSAVRWSTEIQHTAVVGRSHRCRPAGWWFCSLPLL